MNFSLNLDHVGIAVRSIEESESLFLLLGAEKLNQETNPSGIFTWATYSVGGNSNLELISPVAGTESFLTKFLDERGSGLHHVTFEVSDLDCAVEYLEEHDVPVVDYADHGGFKEAFISPSAAFGVLFQLSEYVGEKKVD